MLLSRYCFAACCFVLTASFAMGESVAQTASHGSKRGAPSPAVSSKATFSAARLDMLSRLQAAAVQSGDATRIAAASRELDAELLSLLGTIAASEKRSSEAIDLYRESLALHPEDDLASRLAQLLAHSGRKQGTVGANGASGRLDPVNVAPQALRSAEPQLRTMLANGFNDLGSAEARQQQYEQALHDFQQAERFGPNSPTLLKNIGAAAYRMNDSAEVHRALTEYFQTMPMPDDPRARLMLAMADFDLGHFAQAAANFREAGDAATMGDPRTGYAYALSLARSGQATEANAAADRLTAMDLPTSRLVLVCDVYYTAENYKGAQECYERVVKQDPAMPRAHYFIGESLIHLDRPEEAAIALRAEQAISPNEPNVQASLAFALAQSGHKEEAMALLLSTVAVHPENAGAQYQLGKLLAEQGKTADAIPHLEAAVTQDPAKAYAHYQLAMAYRKQGRQKDAEQEFTRYRSLKDANRNLHAIPEGQPATQ